VTLPNLQKLLYRPTPAAREADVSGTDSVRDARRLAALLFFGVLTMWVEPCWARSVFQIGVFLLAAQKRAIRLDGPTIVLALAAIWPCLQLIAGTTLSRVSTTEAALNWWTFLLIFLLARDIAPHRGAFEQFLRLAVIGGTTLALVSVLAKLTSHGRIFWIFPSGYTSEVFGPFVNRNQFAAWIELLFPVALYLAIKARHIYLVAATILFASVIASASRAGAALVCFETVVILGMLQRRARAVALASALVAIAIAIVGWHDLQGRFHAPLSEPLRADAVRASLQMVGDHPLMGTGLGAWSRIYPRYAGFDSGLFMNQAHNDWAQWAAEGGLPFVLCLLIFAGLLMKPAIRSIYGLGVIALLLHSLVDYPMQQRPALATWFFAMSGFVTNDLLRRAGGRGGGMSLASASPHDLQDSLTPVRGVLDP
jgi:O-antigen ligase/polysaccharide polymerase Wzy-like membrane protein